MDWFYRLKDFIRELRGKPPKYQHKYSDLLYQGPVNPPPFQPPPQEVSQPVERSAASDRFAFGHIASPLVYGTKDNQKHAENFDFLMATAGPVAAYDYLVKHVEGGTALFRSAAAAAGMSSEDTARIVNRYGVGAARGRIEGDEYVLGGNPFTKEGGVRYKLPR